MITLDMRFQGYGKDAESTPLLAKENSKVGELEVLTPKGLVVDEEIHIFGIFRWRNPPPIARKIDSYLTFDTFKIIFVVIIMLACIVIFSVNHEDTESLHLYGVDKLSPTIIPIKNKPSSIKPVLRVNLSVQKIEQGSATITTRIYGCPKNVNCFGDISNYLELDDPFIATSSSNIELHNIHHFFFMNSYHVNDYSEFVFAVSNSNDEAIGITFKYARAFAIVSAQVPIAGAILALVYGMIIFELFHRAICALIGSFICVSVLSLLHERPTFNEVIMWIDFQTISLLFAIMLMVGIYSETGFFEFVAIRAYKFSRGNIWYLTLILCIFTMIISAFLNSVTAMLLLTPITSRLCKVLSVRPEPLILAEVMLANIGGTCTVIGDPQNVIISNDPRINEKMEITFFSFALHATPGVLATAAVVLFMQYLLYKQGTIRRVPKQQKLDEINIWKSTLKKVTGTSEEQELVRQQLVEFIGKLEEEYEQSPDSDEVRVINIDELEATYIIKDMKLFIKCSIILGFVVLAFFIHSFVDQWFELSMTWIAITGCIIMMVVSNIHDVETLLSKVELGTLLFFAALFVLMRGIEEMDFIEWIGSKTEHLISFVPEGRFQLLIAVLLVVWVSAFVSAFIDNIPFVTAMLPIIAAMSGPPLNLPMGPLVWSLVYGTCFGGNGTLIGASANVVACGLSEAHGNPISFNYFFQTGFPTMVISTAIGSIYLVIFHVLIPWY